MKVVIYPRRKHKNKYRYDLISYTQEQLCIIEYYSDRPRTIVLVSTKVFHNVIRNAKLIYFEESYDIELNKLIELALKQYLKNVMTSEQYWRIKVYKADYVLSST